MANSMYSTVPITTQSFTTACPMRVDNIRCRNKPSCENRRDGAGSRDVNAYHKAFDLQDLVLKSAAMGAACEDVESQVKRLMTLRLCMKHQPLNSEAVRCTLDLLTQSFASFRPRVVNTEKQSLYNMPPPQATNSLYPHNAIPPRQENRPKAQPTSTSKTQALGPVTPPASPRRIGSTGAYQFSFSPSSSNKFPIAAPTQERPTAEAGSHKFDFNVSLPKAPPESLTPPSTPENTKLKKETTSKDTKPVIIKSEPNTTPAPRCSRSPVACKTVHHFADYPHGETRSSILDELLDNFEALEIRADELSCENEKLRDEITVLRARCEALKAEE
ncbi:hypothetical protein Q7P37_000885 [Cladosporium fusiforme]